LLWHNKSVAHPPPEDETIDLLRRLCILDSKREECFDRVTRLACSALKAPIAVIAFPDRERYWFKSTTGLDADEIVKEVSFCIHAAPDDEIFVIPDALADPRVKDNPMVLGEPKVRFYAGVPVRSEPGTQLGTLCVLDDKPRAGVSREEFQTLKDLAALVSDLISVRMMGSQLVETQNALRQSEQSYRHLFDNCPVGIYRTTMDGKVLMTNSAILRMLGYGSLEEIQARNIESESLVANRPEFKELMDRDGEVVDYQTNWIRKDGASILVSECAKAFRDESEKIVYFEGTVQDITKQQAALEKLREQEQRWELVLKGTKDAIWDWNPQTRDSYYSDRWLEMLGYRRDEFQHSEETWHTLVHPGDFPRVNQALEAHLRGETEFYEAEYRMRCKDGSFKWILARGKGHVGGDGKVIRMVGSHTDITARKMDEALLRAAQERYRRMFENNPLPVYVFDVETLRILAVNDMAEKLYGYARDEFLQMKADKLYPEEDRGEFRRRVLATKKQFTRSRARRHLTCDGRVIDVEATSHPIDFDGREARIVIVNDISEITLAQQQLRLALERAEEAARVKSRFLATMSHEIRTPMNGIIGMTSLLVQTPMTAEQADYIEMIRVSSDALLNIINDVLDFSKIEHGSIEIEQVEFDLRTMVDRVVTLITPAVLQKGLKISVRIERSLAPISVGDPGRIRQALLNLLANAVKFTAEGCINLRVSCERREKTVQWTCFEVEDTGIGIDPASCGRLFEPFTQADASTTRRFGGTGLGLAISKNLVELMGGTIRCKGNLGQGSTFWFVLPLMIGAEADAPPPGTEILFRAENTQP
jgi:PAS domain S-box-containing protein